MVIGSTQKNSSQELESENDGCGNKWHLGQGIQGLQREQTPQVEKISLFSQAKPGFR